jgi:hypothetical protein
MNTHASGGGCGNKGSKGNGGKGGNKFHEKNLSERVKKWDQEQWTFM